MGRGSEGREGGGGAVSQNRRDLLPGSSMGLAQVLHKADIKKKEISMTKGDVSTEENEAASQRPADNQVWKSAGVPTNWCLGRVLSSRPTRRDLGLDQLSNNRGG